MSRSKPCEMCKGKGGRLVRESGGAGFEFNPGNRMMTVRCSYCNGTGRKEVAEESDPEPESTERPKGKPSPRWAIWARYDIPCQNGLKYLARLRIIQTPLFGIYLHDIFEPDGDRDPHNHPWSFISIVLRGGYVERVYPDPEGQPEHFLLNMHKRFSAHRMGRVSAHRIIHAKPGLKTLILTGPRKSNWGFFQTGRFIPWEEYIEVRESEAA